MNTPLSVTPSMCPSLPTDVPINRYVKLLSATPAQVLELITGPERCQLISQLETLGSDEVGHSSVCGWSDSSALLQASERCFIESALEELEVLALTYIHTYIHTCMFVHTNIPACVLQ